MIEKKGEDGGKKSYVIIHNAYTYLEPVIRSMFAEAEDVQIVVDRRFRDRRQGSAGHVTTDKRRLVSDRRLSSPMLDILINVEA